MVEEPCDHVDIGLRGFDFNIFDEDEEGIRRRDFERGGGGTPGHVGKINMADTTYGSSIVQVTK